MSLQNSAEYYPFVLKLLSGNSEILILPWHGRTHGCLLESHPISSPRAFGSGELKSEKKMCSNPKLDHVNMNTYIFFGENLSICSQDIKQKQTFGVNQEP